MTNKELNKLMQEARNENKKDLIKRVIRQIEIDFEFSLTGKEKTTESIEQTKELIDLSVKYAFDQMMEEQSEKIKQTERELEEWFEYRLSQDE